MKRGKRSGGKRRKRFDKALLIIDMLNDFVLPGAPLECPGARDIIPAIKREIEKARSEGYPVIYVCDNHRENDPEFKVWPRHCVRGTKGAEVVDELKPEKGDYVIKKVTYSGFYKTRLEDLLKRLGVKKLIITGVCTEICLMFRSVDALTRGYAVEVPEDCVAGLTPQGHSFALKHVTETLKPRA